MYTSIFFPFLFTTIFILLSSPLIASHRPPSLSLPSPPLLTYPLLSSPLSVVQRDYLARQVSRERKL